MQSNFSQTQLANIMSFARVIVLVALYFGKNLDVNLVSFVIYAVIDMGITGYNFFQRYKKGDLALSGFRK